MDINQGVFDKMQDELSKELYVKRIRYENGEYGAMEEIITMLPEGKALIEFMELHEGQLYIFGAGVWGRDLQRTWGWKYTFNAYIDNNKALKGKKIEGVPVVTLDEVIPKIEYENVGIIISTRLYWKEVLKQLKQSGVKNDSIFNVGAIQDLFAQKQYFDLKYLNKNTREIFVDIGAFDGKTSVEFYNRYSGKVKKIYLFEPDKGNLEKCKQNVEKLDVEYEIVNKGVWSSTGTCNFASEGNGVSCIMESGEDFIEVIALDEFFDGKEVTFIKMDIEGAELEALKGAENLIRTKHPILAICVYHKKEDIDLIPRLLLDYYKEYQFYVRHYSVTKGEMVLYALP